MPQLKCDAYGCHGKAKWWPVLVLWPARERIQVRLGRARLPVKLCHACKQKARPDHFITDVTWAELTVAFEYMKRTLRPARDACTLEWEPIQKDRRGPAAV